MALGIRHSLAVVLLGLSLALAARANPEVPTSIRYTASEGCPTERDFLEAVESRGGHLAHGGGASVRKFVVTIAHEDPEFTGSFEIEDEHATSEPRRVHSATCSETFEALALIAAVELRPIHLKEDQKPVAPPETKKAESAPNVTQFVGSSKWGNDSVVVGPGRVSFSSLQSFTLSVGAALGPFPSVTLPRYDFTFRRTGFLTLPDGSQRINGPILQVRASSFGPPVPVYRPSGTITEYQLGLGFGFGACWSPYFNSRGLILLACGEFGVGEVAMVPIKLDGSKGTTKVAGFGTVSPILEANYNLGATLHISAKVGADFIFGSFPAQRADGTEVSSLNSWSVYGALGLGMHF